MALVYLNGKFIPEENACVSVLDRGFIFGDGIYEVIPCYGARPFRLQEHLQRLSNNLTAVHMRNPLMPSQWSDVFTTILAQNEQQDQSLYLQITRGVAKRDHAIPDDIPPTVLVMANLMQAPPKDLAVAGVDVITCVDNRWLNCHIKSTSLLANVLLRQEAIEQGAVEAILLRDGYVTEGAASNVFIVKNNVIVTPSKGATLLPGITRDLILELAQNNGCECVERQIKEAELMTADEVWLSSSTKEIVPVSNINAKPVGQGQPGPMWKRLHGFFQTFKQEVRGC